MLHSGPVVAAIRKERQRCISNFSFSDPYFACAAVRTRVAFHKAMLSATPMSLLAAFTLVVSPKRCAALKFPGSSFGRKLRSLSARSWCATRMSSISFDITEHVAERELESARKRNAEHTRTDPTDTANDLVPLTLALPFQYGDNLPRPEPVTAHHPRNPHTKCTPGRDRLPRPGST